MSFRWRRPKISYSPMSAVRLSASGYSTRFVRHSRIMWRPNGTSSFEVMFDRNNDHCSTNSNVLVANFNYLMGVGEKTHNWCRPTLKMNFPEINLHIQIKRYSSDNSSTSRNTDTLHSTAFKIGIGETVLRILAGNSKCSAS